MEEVTIHIIYYGNAESNFIRRREDLTGVRYASAFPNPDDDNTQILRIEFHDSRQTARTVDLATVHNFTLVN